jgi:hypothetical protein
MLDELSTGGGMFEVRREGVARRVKREVPKLAHGTSRNLNHDHMKYRDLEHLGR